MQKNNVEESVEPNTTGLETHISSQMSLDDTNGVNSQSVLNVLDKHLGAFEVRIIDNEFHLEETKRIGR